MAIYLFVIFLSLLVLHIHLRYSRAGRLMHAVPGPPSLPIIGNALQYCFVSPVGIWALIQAYTKTYHSVMRVWFLTIRVYGLLQPDDVKILLTDKENITKGFMYKYMEPVFGKGLVTNTGEHYHSRRKLINPAFNLNGLTKFIEVTNKRVNKFVQELKDEGDETIQNPKLILPRVTLNIICEWSMDIDLRTIEKESVEYQHAIDTFTELVLYRTFRPYLSDWMMKFLEAGRRMDHAVKVTKLFVHKMINDRRTYHEGTNNKYLATGGTDASDSLGTSKLEEGQRSFCLMDLLLSAERDGLIDEKGIIEEIQTIVMAGFDTSATSLSFLLLLLAENKEAQDLARSEVLKTLGENGNEWTIELLKKLDYIDRCIKESMRLFPAVPFVVRTLQKDLHIRNYIIPAGSGSGISIYNIHRNPDFWPNPEQFDPDRFLPEHVKTRHPFAYIPFSAGFRSCIGQRFAMVQMKALIATILCYFQLEPIDKTKDVIHKMDFILSCSHPLRVKFVKLHTKY